MLITIITRCVVSFIDGWNLNHSLFFGVCILWLFSAKISQAQLRVVQLGATLVRIDKVIRISWMLFNVFFGIIWRIFIGFGLKHNAWICETLISVVCKNRISFSSISNNVTAAFLTFHQFEWFEIEWIFIKIVYKHLNDSDMLEIELLKAHFQCTKNL